MTSDTQATATATQTRCSFCGKPSSEVEKLVAGPGVLYLQRVRRAVR
jgi:ClpX C4-type zinc finger